MSLFKSAALKCSSCGRKLSTERAKNSDMVYAIIAAKGFKCGKCGRHYCAQCAMKASMACKCGGVATPVLD